MRREYHNGIPVLTKEEWYSGLKPEDVDRNIPLRLFVCCVLAFMAAVTAVILF